MRKLAIGLSSFQEMITSDYIYVDKTQYIYNIFNEERGKKYYFLSRPRRFGKSLLVSTLKSLFEGDRSLFNGLSIGKCNWLWQEFPVIHLDFSGIAHATAQELKLSIMEELDEIAQDHQLTISGLTPTAKLKKLVKELSKKNKVVILIDEYDKPILDHLDNIKEAKEQRKVLKAFYDTFKSLQPYLRSIFITGVSKFSKTSIFSGLNNLFDLSESPEASQLTGYTEQEINYYFSDYISQISKDKKIAQKALMENIRTWYNGYQFSKEPIKVYNPYSLVLFLDTKEFSNFWFQSGTPTFLIEVFKKNPRGLQLITQDSFKTATLGTFDINDINLPTLLYQTGYMTIQEYDEVGKFYRLTYPNDEIRESLSILEMSVLVNVSEDKVMYELAEIKRAIYNKDLEKFFIALRSLLAGIPYNLHIANEAYYHSVFHTFTNTLIGNVQSEIITSLGVIDLVLSTEKYIYIFEFKFNKSAKEAIKQIREKRYADKYLSGPQEIILVGVSFNYKNKELEFDWTESN